MSQEALYQYKTYEPGEVLSVSVVLNPSHEVFSGHFPGMPVLPGACMLQLCKDVLARESGKQVSLTECDNIKFLGIVNPNEDKVLKLEIKWKERSADKARVNIQMQHNQNLVFKLSAHIAYWS